MLLGADHVTPQQLPGKHLLSSEADVFEPGLQLFMAAGEEAARNLKGQEEVEETFISRVFQSPVRPQTRAEIPCCSSRPDRNNQLISEVMACSHAALQLFTAFYSPLLMCVTLSFYVFFPRVLFLYVEMCYGCQTLSPDRCCSTYIFLPGVFSLHRLETFPGVN